MRLELDCKRINNVVKIVAKGKIDSNTSSDLASLVCNLERPIESLIIDMREVDYISSMCLRTLLTFKLDKTISSISLENINENIKEVLEMTGFIDIVNIV